jgi:hypothetical protein
MNYLEVSSSNRDRNKFPYPSDFDVVLGTPNSLNILDPIITGPRWFTWQGGQGSGIGQFAPISSGVVTGDYFFNLKLTQIQANPIQPFPYNTINFSSVIQDTLLSTDPLYYNGFRLEITNLYPRIISSYNPITSTVTVNPSFTFKQNAFLFNYRPTEIVGTVEYSIVDPSTLNYPPKTSLNQVHLPLTDAFGYYALPYTQSYNNYYLVDETLSFNDTIVVRKITDYQSDLRIATVESSIPGWNNTDIYSIVEYPPPNKYIIEAVDPYTHQITLPSYLNYGTGYFVGQYVYNTGLIGTGPSSSGFSFQMINSTGPVDNPFYVLDYSGAPSNILTLSPNTTNSFTTSLPGVNNYGIPGLNDIITIGTLVRDNFYPLQYSGTVVSQNEAVAYEVTLAQLCLPNVTLTTGSRIAQYPYVYVELRPLGSPSAVGKNVIYSNNPNATNALFTVAISDVVDPLTSVFVRVYSSQVQTIKIKPNDSFHFSVYLPDGSLFLPVGIENEEYFSPFPPNEFLQIEAVFGFRRL